MGFPVLPGVYTGTLPIILLYIAVSIAAFKDAIRSILIVLGFRRGTAPDDREPLGFGPSLVLPSLCEEIRVALPIAPYYHILDCDSSSEDRRCAVCLSDFVREEYIRLLPHCSHIFHKGCLDKWLDHQATTCPLCRSSLIPEEIARKHRRREQELSDELILWFSSFHGAAIHGLWWQN